MTKVTFTYIHPIPQQGVIQHVIKDLTELSTEGPHVFITFEDDKGRELSIQTNQPYVLRTESTLDATATAAAPKVTTTTPAAAPVPEPGPLVPVVARRVAA